MASNTSGLKLKLNIGTSSSILNNGPPTTTTSTPLTATPGGSKFKVKFGGIKGSTPLTPAPAPTRIDEPAKLKKTKAGRAPKPSAKILESRKRPKEESEGEDDDGGTINVQRPAKKIKLKVNPSGPKTPITPGPQVSIKARVKGKPPPRSIGEGYDSEASDREIDPALEDQFILRMMPGDDCDYLRQAILDKRIGVPKAQGGADVYLKFFHGEGRRACVNIRGISYAATLVDLPCIIEGMKSWDKRGWWKSADICQMLWVYAKINTDSDAKVTTLPAIINQQTFQYPHGLTPPMHFARARRFRKRVHKSEIEAVEAEVDRLLKADDKAASTSYEILEPDAEDRRASQAWSPEGSQDYDAGDRYSHDEDAEGEADDGGYFGTSHNQGQLQQNAHANAGIKEEQHSDDDGLEEDLEAALLAEVADDPSEGLTPISTAVATPLGMASSTPAADHSLAEEEDSGDESFESDEDEDDDDGPGEDDPEEVARQAERQGIREMLTSLQEQYESAKKNLSTVTNPLLKRRLEDQIKKLTLEIELKKSSLGEGEED